ncbi:Chaperone, tailless complex polypeptide 1 [Artemisia annua]|uniref:Chaperone, tailless complex polypeptide 1 n=1 Tax=Artemisia annua TaxID=35608 RepID=A0A2U1KA44_ARTAN|nr:Chaperone, tailless complex polypeptide 1 [Artemisia annua]
MLVKVTCFGNLCAIVWNNTVLCIENGLIVHSFSYEDKILQSSVKVTNDGATILKSLHIDNPAAKVLIDISKVQDDEVGDRTTSVVALAGELLREAEKLVATKTHLMTIISGLSRSALLESVKDNKEDAEKFRSDMMKISMTTLSSKIQSQDKEHFATLAVDAVMRLKGRDGYCMFGCGGMKKSWELLYRLLGLLNV